jgi:curved DNA-binding protein CbpA
MGNPYEILGVKESATDEEIKAAYKVMVKKYHPDRHANNPLEDLAEEKLRQVNMATVVPADQVGTAVAAQLSARNLPKLEEISMQTASTKQQLNCSGYKPGQPSGFFWMV